MIKSVFKLLGMMLLLNSSSYAQLTFFRDTSIHVIQQNALLFNAWAGGFNSPVFASIDLDGDGKMDIITYETQTQRIDPFINSGAGVNPYTYSPQYRSSFPSELEGWVRTYDFDQDGDMDLFTYNNGGIRVYRNDYSSSTGLQFSLYNLQLTTHYSNFSTNIYVSRVSMPALSDVDNDGDMDVLSFSIAGNWVEHHKNLSMDSTGNASGFLFYNIPQCWGYFALSSFTNSAQLPVIASCPLYPANPFRTSSADEPIEISHLNLHAGSALLAVDLDGDGDKDLLNGDILGPNVLYLQNCGTPDSAYICTQDSLFPAYDIPASMADVAAPYYFDADNDGSNDLIVANFYTGEDYNNIRFYKNTTNNTTNVFSFQTTRFLSSQMIEMGTGCHPVFVDINGDGLRDLIIANDYYYNGNLNTGKLAYYQNTGTISKSAFTFVTDDFMNISALNIRNLYPTFGDLDGDGDEDMIIGENTGTLISFQNIAPIGSTANFVISQSNYQSIDVGDNAAPQLVDVDRDGMLDLIIGKRAGTVSYFHNVGSTSVPVFGVVSTLFGGVSVIKPNSFAGYSVPVIFERNGSYEMLVGSESGYLYHFTNIDGNLAGTFTLADSMFQNIFEPTRCAPALGDVDGDGKFDLIVGNLSGGCVLYSQNTALSVSAISPVDFNFTLYPNPVNTMLTVKTDRLLSKEGELKLSDLTGRIIFKGNLRSELTVDLSAQTPGAYLCTITDSGMTITQLVIKQ